MFQVGEKVRCIDGSFSDNTKDWADHLPVRGQVYTIRAIRDDPHYVDKTPGTGFWLEEIVNVPKMTGVEPCFSDWRFRSLNEEEKRLRDILSNASATSTEQVALPQFDYLLSRPNQRNNISAGPLGARILIHEPTCPSCGKRSCAGVGGGKCWSGREFALPSSIQPPPPFQTSYQSGGRFSVFGCLGTICAAIAFASGAIFLAWRFFF